MFRLTYFKAKNVIGFLSGLSKRTFELDLSNYKTSPLVIVTGDNASGKSTFLSLVHPLHTPSDGRAKFIVPGKEGSLIRVYEGDDGTVLTSKCLYHPKPDGSGHMPKCFLALKRPGEKEEIELNPNGNVSSYNNLLFTYFGINKDYINFASYSDAVTSIVTMTDMERKNSVATMIPNTGRFEIAYNTVNEKYKELRNMSRNVAQKILAIRDEDSLQADLERVSKRLADAMIERDEYLAKLSKAEGRVKELSHGQDLRQLIIEYNDMVQSLIQFDSDISRIQTRLFSIYKALGIEHDKDSIFFPGIDQVGKQISKYERKLATSEATLRTASEREDKLKQELFQVEKDLTESESVLFSIQTQDIEELKATKRSYLEQLESLSYTKNKDKYEGMTYSDVVNFSRTVSLIDQMIRSLYDEYGEMVSEFFGSYNSEQMKSNEAMYSGDLVQLSASIETRSQKRDAIYRQLIEKEQYRKFQDILDKRPKTCHDDTCPFIANALKWRDISGEIVALKEQYEKLGVEIGENQKAINAIEREVALNNTAMQLIGYLKDNESLILRYFGVELKVVYRAIANGTWQDVLSVLELKKVAAVLSEKDLYVRITTQMLPEIEHAIELAKVYGSNRDMVQSQIDRLARTAETIKEELSIKRMELVSSTEMKQVYSLRLSYWSQIADLIAQYKEIASNRIKTAETAESKGKEIETIKEIVEKCQKYEEKLQAASDEIDELTPLKQQIQMDMATLVNLKAEKDQIEQDFLIVDVIRSIIQPGKGIRKELINIYMYDIYQTANQLLLNTFDGKLYLKEFIITDKEFVIPYVYNGSEGSDIAYASSSQQSTIAMALSLAILSKLIDKYGVVAFDEADRTLSAANKAIFVNIVAKQMRYIGISQAFIITHSIEYYLQYDGVVVLAFPGAKIDKHDVSDVIDIS